MATQITLSNVYKRNEAYLVTAATCAASTDYYFKMSDLDKRFVIIATGTGAASQTITIKKGDNPTMATKDLTLTLTTQNKPYAFTLDSMRYKLMGSVSSNVASADRGTVHFTVSGATTVEIIELC